MPHHRTCTKAGGPGTGSRSSKTMPGLRQRLHQLLVDAGETYHAGCYPPADLREQVEATTAGRRPGGGRAQEGVIGPDPAAPPVAQLDLDLAGILPS